MFLRHLTLQSIDALAGREKQSEEQAALFAVRCMRLLCDIHDSSTSRKLCTTPKLFADVLTFLGFPKYH